RYRGGPRGVIGVEPAEAIALADERFKRSASIYPLLQVAVRVEAARILCEVVEIMNRQPDTSADKRLEEARVALLGMSIYMSAYAYWYNAIETIRRELEQNLAAARAAYSALAELLTVMEVRRKYWTPWRARAYRRAAEKFFSWGAGVERLLELLNRYRTSSGDTFYLPKEVVGRVLKRQGEILGRGVSADTLRSAVLEGALTIFDALLDILQEEKGLRKWVFIGNLLLAAKMGGVREYLYSLALDLVQP
ncbi:MAG: hypothetical protein QXT37_11045, partial [Thermofilaceae archaeon]